MAKEVDICLARIKALDNRCSELLSNDNFYASEEAQAEFWDIIQKEMDIIESMYSE